MNIIQNIYMEIGKKINSAQPVAAADLAKAQRANTELRFLFSC